MPLYLSLAHTHTHSNSSILLSSLLNAQVLRQSPFDACLQILSGSKSNFDERYNAFFIDYSLLPLVRYAHPPDRQSANRHVDRLADRYTFRQTSTGTGTDRHTDLKAPSLESTVLYSDMNPCTYRWLQITTDPLELLPSLLLLLPPPLNY
jgi:hypothetical protein